MPNFIGALMEETMCTQAVSPKLTVALGKIEDAFHVGFNKISVFMNTVVCNLAVK